MERPAAVVGDEHDVAAAAHHEQARSEPLCRERERQDHPAGDGHARATGATSTTTGTAATQTYTYDSSGGADGDLQRLDEIANNLPPRVTSDPVIKLRNKLFGRIDGTVNAVNPYAFSGAGGFRSGPLPYIQITGTADAPQDALDITNQTAVAFMQWFEGRQVANKIPVRNRVVVEQVNSASRVTAGGGTKPLLGVAAALLVLLGGAGLVLALDRLIPRRKPRAARGAAPAAADRELAAPERERRASRPGDHAPEHRAARRSRCRR